MELRYYYSAGDWQPGSYTCKVWLNRVDVYQFYGATGDSDLQKAPLDIIDYSEHYNDYMWAIENSPNMQNDIPIQEDICGYHVYL